MKDAKGHGSVKGDDRSPFAHIVPKKLTLEQVAAEMDYRGMMKGVRRTALRRRLAELKADADAKNALSSGTSKSDPAPVHAGMRQGYTPTRSTTPSPRRTAPAGASAAKKRA